MEGQVSLLKREIEERRGGKRPFLVAIDGGSASGKSTLGEALAQELGAALIHMDDFFLPPALRTAERFAQPGGNVHWERVLEQVLLPFSKEEAAEYGIFDCSVMAVGSTVRQEIRDVIIVEGAYSLHPRLRDFFDLRVLIEVDETTQKERILHRNGEIMLQRFVKEWIPLEQDYFKACAVRDCCHIIL